jgi:dienelactone hydrolase
MVAQLPPEKVEELWVQLESQYGKFKEQGAAHAAKQDVYDVVVVESLFEKAALDMRVVIDADGRIAGLFYAPSAASTPGATPESGYNPPDYVQESSFTEQELSFGDPEWVLTGTLTMPNTPGPHPAVVLVHGSGPLDRDETIGPNKPFRDLAWGLASQGVAVFRYDKRTLAYGPRMAATVGDKITVKEEVVDDAVKALELVKGIDGIEAGRVFLAGHSLGAMLAPMIARSTEAESGFIAMSAPGRQFEDIILDQITYLANLDGNVTTEEQTQLDQLKVQVENVKKLEPGSIMTADKLPLGLPVAYWLSIKDYKPAEEASKLTEQILVLHGEHDYQVTMEDFAAWQTALNVKDNATLKSYPGLNHLFMAGTGTPTPEEYNKEGHVDETVIKDIADWIGRH